MTTIISHTTRTKPPTFPVEKIKNDILGKRYQLSLSFVGERLGQKINQESRNKTYVPNVLSFPLSDNAGEIYITPAVAKREAKQFGHSYKKHLVFLFIHGILHLKGYDHGHAMEKLEKKFLQKYS